jgi:hypothetical protein
MLVLEADAEADCRVDVPPPDPFETHAAVDVDPLMGL